MERRPKQKPDVNKMAAAALPRNRRPSNTEKEKADVKWKNSEPCTEISGKSKNLEPGTSKAEGKRRNSDVCVAEEGQKEQPKEELTQEEEDKIERLDTCKQEAETKWDERGRNKNLSDLGDSISCSLDVEDAVLDQPTSQVFFQLGCLVFIQ